MTTTQTIHIGFWFDPEDREPPYEDTAEPRPFTSEWWEQIVDEIMSTVVGDLTEAAPEPEGLAVGDEVLVDRRYPATVIGIELGRYAPWRTGQIVVVGPARVASVPAATPETVERTITVQLGDTTLLTGDGEVTFNGADMTLTEAEATDLRDRLIDALPF